MKKHRILILVIAMIVVWFGEIRSFYCIEGNRCVTVWKTYNNTCYIIPGKYYGVVKPSKRPYIETTNIAMMTLIWDEKSDTIVVNSSKSKISNIASNKVYIIDYNSNARVYDSLYTYFDGYVKKINHDIHYMNIMIKENYATDKDGNKL